MARAKRSTDTTLPGPDSPLTMLSGVGPKTTESLARIGLNSLADLCWHLPHRYEDRTRITPIARARPGRTALVAGEVMASEIRYRPRPVLDVTLADDSGTLLLRFYHFHRQQQARWVVGAKARCFGEVRWSGRQRAMFHPDVEWLDETAAPLPTSLTPVYPITDGVRQSVLRAAIDQAWTRLTAPTGTAIDIFADTLPLSFLRAHHLPTLRDALQLLHAPPPDVSPLQLEQARHPAQQRLIIEELVAHYLSLRRLREQRAREPAPVFSAAGGVDQSFLAQLPFALTGAQQRVLDEVTRDVAQPRPMQRLVQGDVGSGKTVVAAAAMLQAVAAGYQAALMAPTELLAEQHSQNMARWCSPLGVNVVYVAGSGSKRERNAALQQLAEHRAHIAVGTHALFQTNVQFARLGLVAVDEQHRFGVAQRMALWEKGRVAGVCPHQLILTATPIPRSLAMTMYGDLDISVIDELPPGRQTIDTVLVSSARRDEVVARVRQACADGRQVYWVCPLVSESEDIEGEAAEQTFEALSLALREWRVGLVHGQMKAAAKEQAMRAFRAGELQVLVATTVIEVGVDVPRASVMIIENAERLGLSQLHQLRGRVGRGQDKSACVLMYQEPLGEVATERLKTMRATQDGFEIARQDLRLRGPGEVLGTRQSGELALRIADLVRDQALLPVVREAAEAVMALGGEAVERVIGRWIGGGVKFGAV